MSLEKLVQLGWYKAEPSSPKEIADLFSIVDRSQADSRVEGISDDLRFQAAYNGILTLANIALRASGCRPARDIESPVVEFGLNRRSPERQTHEFHAGVFEIDGIVEEFSGGSWMALEHQIMISSDDNLVPMGLFTQPVIEIDNFLRCVTECHEVPGMNKHITIRHAQFGLLAVGVADADDADPGHRSTLV